jgi:hypothetical protein
MSVDLSVELLGAPLLVTRRPDARPTRHAATLATRARASSVETIAPSTQTLRAHRRITGAGYAPSPVNSAIRLDLATGTITVASPLTAAL